MVKRFRVFYYVDKDCHMFTPETEGLVEQLKKEIEDDTANIGRVVSLGIDIQEVL